MAEPSNSSRTRVTRKQAVMIAGLAAVLFGVLFTGSTPESVTTVDRRPGPVAGIASAGPNRNGSHTSVPVRTRRWPEVSLDHALLRNPFADLMVVPTAPEANPAAAAPLVASPTKSETDPAQIEAAAKQKRHDAEDVMAKFHGHKVKLIVRTDRRATALVGGRLVGEGDIVDGVRIVSILPNGVLVEPAHAD